MANIEKYRQCIQQLLTEYAQTYGSARPEVAAETIFDVERDRYQLIYIGWDNDRRVFGPVLHFEIKNGKIWIEWNGTEIDVAEELIKMGVTKQDIVIGFHPPYLREFTEYAIA